MRDAFIKRLTELAERNPRIFLVTADLGFGVLTSYAEKHPRQYLNVGVAEQNMTGVATGLAVEGRVVFTYSIANFPTLRCLEQLRNDAAYHDANVKVVSIGGGFSYGVLGMSHHATEDLAILRALPQVTAVAPGCLWEVEEATSALATWPGTCYLRLDKSHAGRTNRPDEEFRLGHARLLREGSSATVLVTGGVLIEAMNAVDELAQEGITCDLLSVHTISPFDQQSVLESVAKTGRVITVEEHVVEGGLAGAVAEACFDACIAPRCTRRLGLRGGYSSIVGSQSYLRARYGMDQATISGAIRGMVIKA